MYDECMSKHIKETLDEFKMGTLKLRNNKIVTDKKQAIAIAINMAMKECVMTKSDLKYIEEKIMKFLVGDKRKIAMERIPLTDVIETRMLIEMYVKHKNIKKANYLLNLLFRRITSSAVKGLSISKNIWHELDIINRLIG